MQRENVNLKVARKVVKCLYRPWILDSKCINNRKAWKIQEKFVALLRCDCDENETENSFQCMTASFHLNENRTIFDDST